MTTDQLLEKLYKRRLEIESSISTIEALVKEHGKANRFIKKRAAILNDVKKHKGTPLGHNYNGTHWMQKPENKAKVNKMIAKMQKANKAKHKAKRAQE